MRILQLTLLIQYTTAGTCKLLHGDWATDPMVLWTHLQGTYRTEIAAWMLRTLPDISFTFMMYSALLFELLAAPLFLYRRTRVIAMLWGLSFQTMIALTMYKLIFFSAEMLSFYVLFMSVPFLTMVRTKATQSAKLLEASE